MRYGAACLGAGGGHKRGSPAQGAELSDAQNTVTPHRGYI